jgi:transcriptional regulator with XRE-family HTH domain
MSHITPKSLGERIRELREGRDLSLREFGKKLRLSAAFLSDVELGRRHPSDKVLESMARALGATFEELKALDNRPAVQDLKRRVAQSPAYGFAFRKLMDQGMTPEQLLAMVEKQPKRKKQ